MSIDQNGSPGGFGEIWIHIKQIKEDIHSLQIGLDEQITDMNKARGSFRTITVLLSLVLAIMGITTTLFVTVVYPGLTNGMTDHIEREVEKSLTDIKVQIGVNSAQLGSTMQIRADLDAIKLALSGWMSDLQGNKSRVAKLETEMEATQIDILQLKSDVKQHH